MLTPDRSSIVADRDDLSYITASVVDSAGTLRPDARVEIDFEVSGDGELSAVGTGDPTDVSSFHTGKRTTWHGVAVAIVSLCRPSAPQTTCCVDCTPLGRHAATRCECHALTR